MIGRENCIATWMANPFYALLFERETGFLWWRRTEFYWRIHLYDPPDWRAHSTVRGACGGYGVSVEAAMAHMSAMLKRHGHPVQLTRENCEK